MRRRLPELTVAAIVAAVYLGACCSVVVRKGLSAGPFDLAPIYGFSCALTGWMDYPFGWLANPLVWAGVVLLARRRPGAAAVCGLLAVGPVAQWSVEWHRQGLWRMLRAGYDLWVASVGLLAVGGSAAWAFRRLASDAEPGAAADTRPARDYTGWAARGECR